MSTPTQIQYALMAAASYISTRPNINKFPVPDGWTEKVDKRAKEPTSGFEATTFASGTDLVISFAGTYPGHLADNSSGIPIDFVADLALGTGFGSDQLLQAVEYYLDRKREAPVGATFTFTGHSLGGGLAALVAVFFGIPATTFDQAPFANSAQSNSVLTNPHNILTPDVAANLKADLISAGYSDAELSPLSSFLSERSSLGGILGVIPNANLVNSIRVDGEFLSDWVPVSMYDTIGNAPQTIMHGASPILSGIDLHSQSLLIDFLQSEATATATTPDGKIQSLNEVTYKLSDLLGMLFDKNLFANATDTDKENFLERLVRHEFGNAPGVTQADAMLTRFTSDLWKLAQDGGLTMNEGIWAAYSNTNNVSKALIAFVMQMYYEDTANATDPNKQLFTDLTQASTGSNGIQFATADVATDITSAKGYAQYFQQYLDNRSYFTAEESALITQKIPALKEWYVQAGNGGMSATVSNNNGAFMLGGNGADTLTGGTGEDLLVGGQGVDTLNGGTGKDTLIGGKGGDMMKGGVGIDTYYADHGDTIDDSDHSGKVYVGNILLTGGSGDSMGNYYESADKTVGYYIVGSGVFVKTSQGSVNIKATTFDELATMGIVLERLPHKWRVTSWRELTIPPNRSDLNSPVVAPPSSSGTPSIGKVVSNFEQAKQIVSPIVLDLNGDGIVTTFVGSGTHFDHDTNGFAEATGWVNPEDGLLVRDIDGNGTIDSGRELFGSETLLANGDKAANGYHALSEIDGNHDGLIDAQDAAYSTLRIWKDSDGDGVSSAGELLTLTDAGVQSIATGSIAVNQTDTNGNTVKQTGTFTRADGSPGYSADIWFAVDKTNTIATDWLPETVAVAALPNLQGYGNVRDLHQAMLRDSSGHLQDLVQQFVNATTATARHALTDQIIYAWVGVESVAPNSRGYIEDARQLCVIEAFMGEGYIQGFGLNAGTPNTGPNAAKFLTGMYNELAAGLYSQLMAQTHLKPLLDSIGLMWDATTNSFDWDVSGTVVMLQDLYSADVSGFQVTAAEFSNALKQNGDSGQQVLITLRAQGDTTGSGFAGWLGQMGYDDVLVGDEGNNTLTGSAADQSLFANGGNDHLDAGEGNDYLDGGAGNDYLQGGSGNDIYQFNLGSGQDEIFEMDASAENVDVVRFGDGIASGDLTLTRRDYDIVVSINGTTDELTLMNWGGGNDYRIERFEFADGVVWDAAQLKSLMAVAPAVGDENDNVMFAWDGENSLLQGLGGSDMLYGFTGNDTLDGGAGDDRLNGGGGSDTYIYRPGDGADTIVDSAPWFNRNGGEENILSFGAGITPDMIRVRRDGFSGCALDLGNGDSINIGNDAFNNYILRGVSASDPFDYFAVQTLLFADGTRLNVKEFVMGHGLDKTGTPGNDYLMADSLYYYGRNSWIETIPIPDRLTGGTGNDTLIGGSGGDIYTFNRGDGADTIMDTGTGVAWDYYWNCGVSNDPNTLSFGAGIAVGDITARYQGGTPYTQRSVVLDLGGGDSINIGINPYDLAIQTLQFADGTSIGTNDFFMQYGLVQSGTAGGDYLLGTDFTNLIQGFGGGDYLSSANADDTLDGGTGNDTLIGGGGTDTYVYNLGDGADVIADTGWILTTDQDGNRIKTQQPNTLKFGAGITPDTITPVLNSDTLTLELGNGDRISIGKWKYFEDFSSYTDIAPYFDISVQHFQFNDGTMLSVQDFLAQKGLQNLYEAKIQFGSTGADVLDGGAGDDISSGYSGNDALSGADGNDYLFGGDGADVLDGGNGNDTLDAGAGDDTVNGGAGDDIIRGGRDNNFDSYDASTQISNSDMLYGGDGSDTIDGGSGNDTIEGGAGDDTLNGGDDDYCGSEVDYSMLSNRDTIQGGDGNDTIDGGSDADTLFGGTGDDVIYGGDNGWGSTVYDLGTGDYTPMSNNDILDGGTGQDSLIGGLGDDVYVVDGNYIKSPDVPTLSDCGHIMLKEQLVWTNDTVIENADEGYDIVMSSGSFTMADNVEELRLTLDPNLETNDPQRQADLLAFGQNGIGNGLDNLIVGNGIANRLQGGAGNDTLDGGDGNDTLVGDAGNDIMLGGAGDDRYVFRVGDGADTITDWQGNDTLFIGNEITAEDIVSTRIGDDLRIEILNSTDSITLTNWFNQTEGVGRVQFCDSATMDNLFNFAPDPTTPITDQIATQDAPFSFTLPPATFVDPNAGDSLSYSASMEDGSELPTWLSFDALTQTFSGMPSNWDVGNLNLTVSATDQLGLTASDTFMLNVLNVNDAPTVANPLTDQQAISGQEFNLKFEGGISASGSILTDATDTGTTEQIWPNIDSYLSGSGGDDSYTFARGDGNVYISDWDNTLADVVQLADVLPGDVTVAQNAWGEVTLSVNGTTDSLTLESWRDNVEAKIEQLVFADGTVWGVGDIQSRLSTAPTTGNDHITATDNSDTILALAGDDAVMGGTGNDTIVAGAGHDWLVGGGGSDLLFGGSGEDEFASDYSTSDTSNDLLDGGTGNDYLGASIANDLLIGGQGDDTISPDAGNNVILFNRGDGLDLVHPDNSSMDIARADTLSLGGGIQYSDLAFERDNFDLILNAGNGDSLYLYGWFDAWQDGKTITTLQLIAESMPGYDPNSADPLLNQHIQQFNFLALANQFESALAADPSITSWQLQPHLADCRIGGSDTAAIGGDMAYLYGKNGNLDGLSEAELRAGLNDAAFGTGNQLLSKTAQGTEQAVFADIDLIHGDNLTYSATLADGTALPSWLIFDSLTQTFSGIPANGDAGLLSVIVTATDTGGLSASTTFNLDVISLNEAPIAVADMVAISADATSTTTTIAIADLLANDTDPDAGDSFGMVSFDAVSANGNAVAQDADGNFVLDIGANYQSLGAGQTATDSFTYTIADVAGETSTATVEVTINGVNDAPVVAAAIADQQTNQDAQFSFTVPDYTFTDVDQGDVLSYSATLGDGSALPSWLTFDAATQTFSGTPLNADVGKLNVVVTATDSGGLSASSTSVLAIINLNDTPTANADTGNAAEDGGAVQLDTATLLANDTDPDFIHGDVLNIVGVSQAVSGAAVSLLNGAVQYDIGTLYQTLAQGQTATDSFAYTVSDNAGATSTAQVTLTITGINDGPVAASDAASAQEDSALAASGNVLANDSDIDQGTQLTVTSAGTLQGNYGSLVLDADGNYSYQLDNASAAVQGLLAGQTVTDTFAYQASDGIAATPATLTVTITGTNDGPVANNDSATTDEDCPLTLSADTLLANDTDADIGDSKTLVGVDAASTLGAAVSLQNGQVVYAQGARFNSLMAGQTLTDSFSYTMTDSAGAISTATVNVTVAGVNDGPTANSDNASTNEDTTQTLLSASSLLANDTDPDTGDVLSLVGSDTVSALGNAISRDASGNLVFDIGNRYQYLAQGQTATDSFGYTVSDISGATSTAQVTLTIVGANDGPVATNDTASVQEDSAIAASGNVLTNDSDIDQGTVLTVADAGTRQGSYGSLVLNTDGSYRYQLDNASTTVQSLGRNERLTEHFGYTTSDGIATAAGGLDILIAGTNDAPILAAPIADQDILFNKAFSWQIPQTSFTDIDRGDTLTYSATQQGGTALPAWLIFDAATRTFTGQAPKKTATVDITVIATDMAADGSTQGSLTASDTFRISVGHGNEGVGNGCDLPPPGHDSNHNDGYGTSPGHPGSQGGQGQQSCHGQTNDHDDGKHDDHGQHKEKQHGKRDNCEDDTTRDWFAKDHQTAHHPALAQLGWGDNCVEHQVNRNVARGCGDDYSKQWAQMNDKLKQHLARGGDDEDFDSGAGLGNPIQLTASGLMPHLGKSAGVQMKAFAGLNEGMERVRC